MEEICFLLKMLPILAGSALAGLLIYFIFLRKPSVRGIAAVKGGLPFVGHVFTLLKGSAWDKFASWVHEYGTIFAVSIFGSQLICVADPVVLKIILHTKLNSFSKDREWTYKPFLVLLGNGLVTSHGPVWLRQRTVLSTHFKKDILESIPTISARAVTRLINRLLTLKEIPEMAAEFRHLTLQVIAEVLVSLSPQESDETFAKMYLPIVEEGNLRIWQPWRMYLPIPAYFQFIRDVDKLNNYVTQLITNRWQERQQQQAASDKQADTVKQQAADQPTQPKPKPKRAEDVLDKMLASITDPKEDWNAAMIEQFRDEIKTYVLAGHETSASMLAWTLYELTLPTAKHHLTRVLADAQTVFASCMDPHTGEIRSLPTKEQLDTLTYMECCLKESLRKYSPVPTVVRVANEDVTIDAKQSPTSQEIFLPKGSTMMISMQGVHHNPTYFPDPLAYQPERFLPENLTKMEPYTFLPFIEGPRMCLGQYLSLLESKIVLSLLLLSCNFSLQTSSEVAGRKHKFMIPIIPDYGHYMKVTSKYPARKTVVPEPFK